MTVRQARQKGVPAGYRIYPSDDIRDNEVLLREEPLLHGGDMMDAQASIDPRTNLPTITFRFNAAGTTSSPRSRAATSGAFWPLSWMVGCLQLPVIQEPILGGVGQIAGNFTSDSAAQLAARNAQAHARGLRSAARRALG